MHGQGPSRSETNNFKIFSVLMEKAETESIKEKTLKTHYLLSKSPYYKIIYQCLNGYGCF